MGYVAIVQRTDGAVDLVVVTALPRAMRREGQVITDERGEPVDPPQKFTEVYPIRHFVYDDWGKVEGALYAVEEKEQV